MVYFIIFHLFSFFIFSNERIENGQNIPIENSVHQSIVLFNSHRGQCTATFLNRRFLLTAAHCTYRTTAAQSHIYARSIDQVLYKAPIRRLITHPSFQIQNTAGGGSIVKNDIALIELAAEFPMTISPIRIGNITEYVNKVRTVSIYGYGKSNSSGGSGTLRWGRMFATVENIPAFYNRSGLSMVPETDQALCPGDSGGPVIKVLNSRRYIIGINSLSNGCKNADETTSKAEIVYPHLTWIRQYVTGI